MSYEERIDYLETLISDIRREGALVPPLYYLMSDNEDWYGEEELKSDIYECQILLDRLFY